MDINEVIPDTRGIDYSGKTLVIKMDYYWSQHIKASTDDRRLYCTGGFGAKPDAIGTKVFGIFLEDGERSYVRRSDVMGLAKYAIDPKDAEKKAKEWDKVHPF